MAQLSTQELQQIQSYLAGQGVVFQPDTTDATKREIVYAAVNQLTRNPAQVFGHRLDYRDLMIILEPVQYLLVLILAPGACVVVTAKEIHTNDRIKYVGKSTQ